MRVMVTGATGFIGSHVVRGLLAEGVDVAVLVRSRDRLAAAIGEDAARVDVITGDVTEPESVAEALDGSDAAVHAAGLVTVDAHRADELQRVNVGGTELVLGEGVRRGLDPVVYVSSIAALFPPSGPVLRVDDEVHQGRSPYSRSKADAEVIARRLQADGAPVTTLYPGGVWGPDAPSVGEPMAALAAVLRLPRLVVLDTPGGMPTVDVRDVASAIVAALRPGFGPRRFMLGGSFLTLAELGRMLERLTGRRARIVPMPGAVLRAAGRVGDLVRRAVSIEFPLTLEAMEQLTRVVPTDDEPTLAALGLMLRPLEETTADTVRWLVAAGHLPARAAGALVDRRG